MLVVGAPLLRQYGPEPGPLLEPGTRASPPPPQPAAGGALTALDVLVALRERLAPDTVVVEECPSSRPELLRTLPARRPMGFLNAAMAGSVSRSRRPPGCGSPTASGRWSRAHPGRVPWPGFEEIDLTGMATALGCPARRIEARDALAETLDEVVPGLAAWQEPLLLEVRVDRVF